MTRIIAISDTHGLHEQIEIPDGDILIHAGDLSGRGTLFELKRFNDFLSSLPHRHKIVVAGNHDLCIEQDMTTARAALTACHYLQDQAITLDGLKFYGSPWQPEFLDWAFNLPRGPALRAKWDLIPSDTDVLITHSPLHGIGDTNLAGELLGCEDLKTVVHRIRPRLHIFGHIHEGYGRYPSRHTEFINASICDAQYLPANQPLVVDL